MSSTIFPCQHPVFSFIQEHGPVDHQEAYANLNMGAGFALYVRENDVAKLLSIAHSLGMSALRAGTIASSETKKVIIHPLGLEYLVQPLESVEKKGLTFFTNNLLCIYKKSQT